MRFSPDQLSTFADLSPAVRLAIASAAIPARYRAGQVLFRAGDAADALYAVVEGRIRVSRETANHVELLHTESGGGLLGEIPVFGGGAFPATATATEPTLCARLPKASIDRLLGDHPEFARFALHRLARRGQTLLRRIDELTATTITARLARHLVERGRTGSDFTLGMSQEALAEELGTAREVVVRALGSLVELGAIARTGRSRFAVSNAGLLRSIAGE